MEDSAVTKEQQYAALLQQRTGITKRRTPSSFEECPKELSLPEAQYYLDRVIDELPSHSKVLTLIKGHGDGHVTCDGRCCYLKRESVDLAIQLLNDSDYRGYRIYVELAHFEQKGKYQPGMKKNKPAKKQKKITIQDKLLGWKESAGPSRSKYDRIVVLEHMFHPKDFENSPATLQEVREDVREECEKFGPVRKIMVFDRHPDGIVSVAFKEFESADMCIAAMQGRYFASRRIQAHAWDGVTNYQVEETEEEKAKRLRQWEKFLEEDGAAEDKELGTGQTAAT